MRTARNAIAVGLITVAMATGLYLALNYVSESAIEGEEYRLYAIFPDATGVVARSQIKMAGIPVGYIETIELHQFVEEVKDPDGGPTKNEARMGAKMTFVIHEHVKIYKNATALRSADGLLGNQFIVIAPGSPTKPGTDEGRLEDGAQIMDVQDSGLMGHLNEVSGDIKQVTENLKNVFGSEEGGRNMSEALANLRDISESMKELLENNQDNVNGAMKNINVIARESRPEVKQILGDIKAITSELRVLVETNSGKAEGVMDEADGTVRDLRTVVAKLDRTLENIEEISGGLKDGEGTAGRLLKDDKLIDDVEEAVDGVGSLVKGITDLKTVIGLPVEYYFKGSYVKTGVQLRLQPREDKYYLIEAMYDPRGSTSWVERTVESNHPDEPDQYTETINERRSALLFSFMFARRLYFATFRAGLKESTGGLGMDLHFLRDRIELNTDLYRFGDYDYPLLKQTVAFEFLRHMYVMGGVNDVLNDNRDYFVGFMLRFNDEDLKTMLPFMPAP